MITNDKTTCDMNEDDQRLAVTDVLEPACWVDVARVANLAEAGFIVDELVGIGLPARVHQLDGFSAATDRWSAQYLIRVPEGFVSAAATQVEQYLAEEPDGKRTLLQKLREQAQDLPRDQSTSWRPVLVVVLVGVTSFLLGHQTSEQVGQRPVRSNQLGNAISAVGRPFIAEPAANQPGYRLSFDGEQHLWTLGVDRDHDGVYESSRHFTVSGAAH
ncbi:MAG TPA: hypothetical protein VH107_06385 [Lacipirellulaceae bacterium]|jgi:hypothetical protein|nr:hypothetical protein [Lacipirellulaceae bacterium]